MGLRQMGKFLSQIGCFVCDTPIPRQQLLQQTWETCWAVFLFFHSPNKLYLFTSFSFSVFILPSSEEFKWETEEEDFADKGNENRKGI